MSAESAKHCASSSPMVNGDITYVASRVLWDGFADQVANLVETTAARDLGELGGGANPTMSLLEGGNTGRSLTVLDVSSAELAKAPDNVVKIEADLCAPEPPVSEAFDLLFSRMLCEHVTDGGAFHRNCFEALRPGGLAVHFFPAATALPFALNRAMPERASQRLLEIAFPDRRQGGRHGKFPARYRWCWGPTGPQLDRYRSVGFELVSYQVGLGHHYYDRIPMIRNLEWAKTCLLYTSPSPRD